MSHNLNETRQQSFPKAERLNSKKLIQELFDKGSSFYVYPFKVIFLPNTDATHVGHQVLISVSKKRFKRAVDRNLIKRRIKESYRLNKQILYSNETVSMPMLIAYIYTGKEIHNFQLLESKLIKSLHRLIGEAASHKKQDDED